MPELEEYQEIRLILIRNDEYTKIANRFAHRRLPDKEHLLTLQIPEGFHSGQELEDFIDRLKVYLEGELTKTDLRLENE